MLSMDDPNEKGSGAADATADDNNWAGFQCMLWASLFLFFIFKIYHESTNESVSRH